MYRYIYICLCFLFVSDLANEHKRNRCKLDHLDNAGNSVAHVAVSAAGEASATDSPKRSARRAANAGHDPLFLQKILELLAQDETNAAAIAEKLFCGNKNGATPLHLAASVGNPKAVEMLLASGRCDPTTVDGEGKTPKEVAQDNCLTLFH